MALPSLLILFTQALTAAMARLLPALPFLVRYINGSGGGAERDGRPSVRPSSARPFVGVSHTDGVIHLMKAATASLSAAAAAAMKPSRSHAPKKTAPTGSASTNIAHILTDECRTREMTEAVCGFLFGPDSADTGCAALHVIQGPSGVEEEEEE